MVGRLLISKVEVFYLLDLLLDVVDFVCRRALLGHDVASLASVACMTGIAFLKRGSSGMLESGFAFWCFVLRDGLFLRCVFGWS